MNSEPRRLVAGYRELARRKSEKLSGTGRRCCHAWQALESDPEGSHLG